MEFKIVNDWQLDVEGTIVTVQPPITCDVRNEIHCSLYGRYAAQPANWTSGQRLNYLISFETTIHNGLVPGSVVARDMSGRQLQEGTDFGVCYEWGSIWLLGDGSIEPGSTISVDYSSRWLRLDAVFRSTDGTIRYAQGTPAVSCPVAPEPASGQVRLLNIIVRPDCTALTNEMLYPVLVTEFDDTEWRKTVAMQQRFIPKVMEKLRKGETVRIFCWGDSITEGIFLLKKYRWQDQFVNWLRQQYPQATIEMESLGWGGKRMCDFRNEPAGSPYSYQEQVLARAQKFDLIISEFNNDCGNTVEFLEKQYAEVLEDFRKADCEWVILSSNYSMPIWMPFPKEQQTEYGEWLAEEPRDGFKFMKRFCAENQLPFADGAREYGRIWKKGIPFTTLLTNGINHPNAKGMSYLADALKPIFQP